MNTPSLILTLCLIFTVLPAGHLLPAWAGATPAGQSFALLISGDNSTKHEENISLAVEALRGVGYREEQIFIVSRNGKILPGSRAHYHKGTKKGLQQALDVLRTAVRPTDTLLVYTTGHGDRAFGKPVLILGGGLLGADRLVRELDSIPFGRLIFVADQCYSGGFVTRLAYLQRDVVAVSSTDELHEVLCVPFIRAFWRAVGSSRADDNGDGIVSVAEAFRSGRRALSSAIGSAQVKAKFIATGKLALGEVGFSGYDTQSRSIASENGSGR